jgi:hypothetical protein
VIISQFYSTGFEVASMYVFFMFEFGAGFFFYFLFKKFNIKNIETTHTHFSLLKFLQVRRNFDRYLDSSTTRLEAIRNWNELIESNIPSQSSIVDRNSYI